MIKLRKWSDSSDVDMAVLAEELEQFLLAVYEVSPWTADQVAEVLRSTIRKFFFLLVKMASASSV